MCGVAGIFSNNDSGRETLASRIKSMTDVLSHRGPDDSGIWIDEHNRIALGHRRLSIIDLSPEGHQPMHSACGRYTIIFNGEIYNFQRLRIELEKEGCRFRGHSDTEVMLAAIVSWGLEPAIQRFIGMFAFALWDKREQALHLVRDRLGIKPLYWGKIGRGYLFASELKALRTHPEMVAEVNRDALSSFMRHSYIPTPHTIYTGVYKLPPASIMTFRNGREPVMTPYWKMENVVAEGLMQRNRHSEQELALQTESLIEDAIELRMVADVPLGTFLSGGIDSSTVAAIMQDKSQRRIKTFSIGFHDSDYNEARFARRVAEHLGTEHTEFYVRPEDAMAVIPSLPEIYDEPFADSSQIPTYLVSRLTRQHVTVALSGDGGDELFAGYNRYYFAENIVNKINLLPAALRRIAKRIIYLYPPRSWSKLFSILPSRLNIPQGGEKLYKLAEILNSDADATYQKLISHWDTPDSLVLDSSEASSALSDNQYIAEIDRYIEKMQYLDTISYLPDDILTKVDRASMAVSLEARVPLLDHRLVEHAWRLPISMKMHGRESKWILKRILSRYIPTELVTRPKMGFAIPIDDWLRGPLRPWAEQLLDNKRIREQGYLDASQVDEKWQEHLSGRRNWQYHLWDVLMFQAWHERWME